MSTGPRKTVPVLTEVLQVSDDADDVSLTPLTAESPAPRTFPTSPDPGRDTASRLDPRPHATSAAPAQPRQPPPGLDHASMEPILLRIVELLQSDVDHPALTKLRDFIDERVRKAVAEVCTERLPQPSPDKPPVKTRGKR